jgi:hypothetical protein
LLALTRLIFSQIKDTSKRGESPAKGGRNMTDRFFKQFGGNISNYSRGYEDDHENQLQEVFGDKERVNPRYDSRYHYCLSVLHYLCC